MESAHSASIFGSGNWAAGRAGHLPTVARHNIFWGLQMKRLDGKIAVVTGASSGIGRAITERFVAEGAKVVAFARNAASLQELEAAHPGQVIAVCGDVTRQEDLERLLQTTLERVGPIDILVPNAGIARVAPFADSTAEVFATQFSV
ncbi:MAG: SDR family NAD(P)-dependent oxidoreductase, partial [Simplicispira sp.]|nr:SDR family NAD(P)-dependent oxidoreductase [Simplicispira sp.]